MITIVLLWSLGSEGKNEEFQPQNEFMLDPWITIELGGIDFSINKAVLYLLLASVLTIGTMTCIANRMQREPNRVQMAVELAYDLTKNNIAGGNIAEDEARSTLVPLPGEPLLLHLVLEHDRLPAAADQHRAQGRHLRRWRCPRSRSTRRPRTSRSRWC